MPPIRSSIDIWTHLDLGCHVVVPVNCELKKNGSLVMGAGLAKAVSESYPSLSGIFGMLFKESGPGVFHADCSYYDGSKVGAFISLPTKVLWREPAVWPLIKKSLTELVALTDRKRLDRVYVPKVGCGLGGLDWSMVSEVLEEMLDERFTVPLKPEGSE